MVVWSRVIVGSKDTKKFSNPGYSLKLEPVRFDVRLDLG